MIGNAIPGAVIRSLGPIPGQREDEEEYVSKSETAYADVNIGRIIVGVRIPQTFASHPGRIERTQIYIRLHGQSLVTFFSHFCSVGGGGRGGKPEKKNETYLTASPRCSPITT